MLTESDMKLTASELSSSAVTNETQLKEPTVGLYLTEPHGKYIYDGTKTLIVKHRKFTEHVNEPLYLLSDGLCYGVICLKEPVQIGKQEFDKLRNKTRITEEEYRKWKWNEPLYKYEFTFQKYSVPKPVRIPRGVQVFVDACNISFLNTRVMTAEELEYYHSYYQSCSRRSAQCRKCHFKVAIEMLRRGMEHLELDTCDRVVMLLVKGWIDEYNEESVSDKQLVDDYRICMGWYSAIKRGKKLYKRVGDQKKEISTDDCKQLALKIFREMIKRGFKFSKPENYKEHAKELFEWLIEQVGKDKVPFKEKDYLAEYQLPEGMTIEDINPDYVVKLSNSELLNLWRFLVREAEKAGAINEPLESSAIFTGIEMYKRGLWDENKGNNILEKRVELAVEEYPTPRGLSDLKDEEPEGEYITLEQVVKAFPSSVVVKGEPYACYIVGRLVNEGKIPKSHDIDLVFRQHPDPRVIDAFKSIKPEWLSRRIHVIFDPNGPLLGFSINLLKTGFFKVPEDNMKKGYGPYRLEEMREIKVGTPLVGVKPRSGFGKFEFFDPRDMWLNAVKDYIDEGVFIEEKVDGRRQQLHVDKEKNIVKIITEDTQRDRADQFPNIVKEILEKLKCKSAIIDGEMVPFILPSNVTCKNARMRRELGRMMEREDSASITVGKVSPELEEQIVYVFYDIMYLDGEPLVNKPYIERNRILESIVPDDCKYMDTVRKVLVKNLREYTKAVAKMRNANGSEGVVGKASQSFLYPVKFGTGENRSDKMFKLKNLKEIDVMVWDVIEKKRSETGEPLGNYMYESVYLVPEDRVDEFQPDNIVEYNGKHYAIIGRSYATNVKAGKGDIITVMPIRIREYKNEKGLKRMTWMFPYFKEKRIDKSEPDTLTTVERIAKLGTRPAPESLNELSLDKLEYARPRVVIKLPLCPYSKDKSICPLKRIFARPRYHELTTVKIEHLKFPVNCPIANVYRCVYLKGYYYGYKTYDRRSFNENK